MLDGVIIAFKVIKVILGVAFDAVRSKIASTIHRYSYTAGDSPRNVVVVGASFAGYHAAKCLANSLPSGYRVIVVEKSSHFQFTWVFPRYSVVPGHEHKAFIPYGPYLSGVPKGSFALLQDTVTEVDASLVHLQSGTQLEYDYLIIATGSEAGAPSRLNAPEKEDAIQVLRNMQDLVREANKIVVVGGGPAGVEIASDTKCLYPEKNVTLIHSRKRILNAFGAKLHDTVIPALEALGVRLILGERVGSHDERDSTVTLGSGNAIPCDLLVRILETLGSCKQDTLIRQKIRCTGQKAASGILAKLCPASISKGGYLKVRSTLQIADERFGNIYAVGDVAEGAGPMNGQSATRQAESVSANIVNAIKGNPLVKYVPNLLFEGGIDLTIGLVSLSYTFEILPD